MPPYCRLSLLAMVLAVVCVHCEARGMHGCAALENASVVDVYYEYSSSRLDRMTAK